MLQKLTNLDLKDNDNLVGNIPMEVMMIILNNINKNGNK